MLPSHFNKQIIDNLLKKFSLENYQVVIRDRVDSTNTYALEHLPEFTNNTVIVSEEQTEGRGRNGKQWLSRPYIDLMVSFIHNLSPDVRYDLMPLVIAIGINRMFKSLRISTKIKWPNDIFLVSNGTKLSGILLESKMYQDKRYIITGIGINNIQNWDKNELLVFLIKHVNDVLNEYLAFGFAMFRQEWLDNCIHYKQMISLYQGNSLLGKGIHSDLTSDGKLKIKDIDSGEILEFSGSKISLIIEG